MGDYLGDLTDELDCHTASEFGPKSYAYRRSDGVTKCKFKGIVKSLYSARKINMDSMLACITDPSHQEEVVGTKFQLDWFRRIQNRRETKMFKMVYDKRYIDHMIGALFLLGKTREFQLVVTNFGCCFIAAQMW